MSRACGKFIRVSQVPVCEVGAKNSLKELYQAPNARISNKKIYLQKETRQKKYHLEKGIK